MKQKCPNCGNEIDERAVPLNDNSGNSSFSTTVLLIFTIVFSVTEILGLIISEYAKRYEIAYYIWIIQILSFFLLPLAIKKRSLRILGFVLLIPVIIFYLYYEISFLFDFYSL